MKLTKCQKKQDIACKIGAPDPWSSSTSLSSSLSLPSLSISELSAAGFEGTSSRLFPVMLDTLNIPIEFQEGFSACRTRTAMPRCYGKMRQEKIKGIKHKVKQT